MSATDPWLEVRRIVGESRSSFLWGMRVLRWRQRRAIYAVYALSRVVDNIADEPGTIEEKLESLAWWQDEIERMYEGRPQHSLGIALRQAIQDYALPKPEFLRLLAGMRADAKPTVRVTSTEALLDYCRQVAGSVGVLSIHIFGLSQPPGPRFAVALGDALQITNVLRDVHEDATLDRLYLPMDLLSRYRIESEPLAQLPEHPNYSKVCAELSALARSRFEEAEFLIKELGWRRTRPAVLMKVMYQAILDRLEQAGWRPAVRLSRLEALWIIARSGWR